MMTIDIVFGIVETPLAAFGHFAFWPKGF